MAEMQPFRPTNSCGHPVDCCWFWQDAEGRIHKFCIPCMAGILQKQGLRIDVYQNAEEFAKAIGGKQR